MMSLGQARFGVAAAAFAALTPLGAGTAAFAHHAFAAEFDADAPVLLKGPVATVEWVNPHTWIHITVPDTDNRGQGKKGTTFNWAIEGGTPNTLFRTGVTRDSLKVGTEIVVRGYQSKDRLCDIDRKTHKRTYKANGRDVTLPNGCKLFIGSSGTGAPVDDADAATACRPSPT
ncbi:MAG TPA: DUF6152 family protein [Hyphomonadaceae bacterium]|nr:DUF6152 family protein [Hyphomonadaceae bacterium]